MTNKEASAKQEKMVADFMGWKVVTGSGSRPFRPGDVQNDNYLVECKTHVTEQLNIVFKKEHWNKISKESRSVNKYPALITDNGTQRAKNTWVMIPNRVIIPEIANKILNFINNSRSGNTVTFDNVKELSLYEIEYDIDKINFFPAIFDNEQVAIMSLSEFKRFYQSEFEC